MRLAAFVLPLLLVPSVPLTDALAGACATGEATSITMSAQDVKLPADGGIIVASSTLGFGGNGGAPNAKNPSWRFRGASAEYVPEMVSLAPGLVSYRPPADAVGPLTLVAGTAALRSLERSTTEEPKLAAPNVFRVRAKTTPATRMTSGTTTIYVDLKAKPPKDAFALVLFAVAKDGTTTARSWGLISDGEKTFNVYQTPNRCEAKIPGFEGSSIGEKVQIAFVDTKGRLSPVSKTFTVQRGR